MMECVLIMGLFSLPASIEISVAKSLGYVADETAMVEDFTAGDYLENHGITDETPFYWCPATNTVFMH